jgi:hypothetical protein
VVTLATQSANLVFAGPTTGAAAAPAFRGLVIADLPTSIPIANLAAIANNTVLGNTSGVSAVPTAQGLGTVTELTSAVLTLSGWSSATVGSPTITVKQATSAQSGYLTSTDWNTFNNKQAALSISNLTEATSAVLTITGGTGSVIGSGTTIQVKQASTSVSGFLSSTDWNTFNGKQAGPLTGDITTSGAVSTLATVNSNVGSFTNASITVNAKGLVTAASTGGAGLTNPMTTLGDIIVGGASGVPTRQGIGTTGQVVGVSGGVPAYLSVIGPTTGMAIVGTNTNNSAASGQVGEYVESVVTTFTNFPTSLAYGDLTSISLTAGDWDVTACYDSQNNSAVVTYVEIGISTTTGNSTTGLQFGSNRFEDSGPIAASDRSMMVPAFRVSLASTTTVYLKFMSSYTTATPQARGRISARRMR